MAETCTSCNWNAQPLEVLQSSLMATLEDDRTELENYRLTYWQPMKIIPKCRVIPQTFAFTL